MKFKKCIFKFLDNDDKHLFDNLKNRELISKHYNNFNDPYESHFGVSATWPNPYKETEKLTKLIQQVDPHAFKEITKIQIL